MNPNDKDIPGPHVVFALYRPHDGKDAELRAKSRFPHFAPVAL